MHICQTFQQSHSVTVWCNLCCKHCHTAIFHWNLLAEFPGDQRWFQMTGSPDSYRVFIEPQINAYIYPLSGVVHVTWIVCALGLTGNNIGTNWKKCLGGRERAIVIFYDLEKIYSDTRAEAEQTSWSSAPLCSALEEEKLLIAWHVTIVAKHLAHM